MSNVSGYSLNDYGRMITGPVRMEAYAAALQAAVSSESIVLDIGAGSGIMSMLACKFGARHVYAIEPNDSINVARKIAKANGFADRITFYHDISTNVELPERANLIVSDLRGLLPVFEHHVSSIVDARLRHLAPGGVLIPQKDNLWVGVVETPDFYEEILKPWGRDLFGINFSSHRIAATDEVLNQVVDPDSLVANPLCFAHWDYRNISDSNVSAKLNFSANRSATAHGLSLWFDTLLFDDIGFSTKPGNERLAYGMGFLPLTYPVDVDEGDQIELELKCNLVGDFYVWQWNTRFFGNDSQKEPKAGFKQSNFQTNFLKVENLRKRASNFVPKPNEEGEMVLKVLQMMNGKSSLEEIARWLAENFSSRHPTWQDALGWVGKISSKYSD